MSNEFPTLVYKANGDHQRFGGTYSFAPANDKAELEALLKQGWFATLPAAVAALDEAPVKQKPRKAQSEEQNA